MALLIRRDDFARAIGRKIIADNQLISKVRLLHEHALDCLAYVLRMIVGHHEHAHLGVKRIAYGAGAVIQLHDYQSSGDDIF
jgi:hypothetical protein